MPDFFGGHGSPDIDAGEFNAIPPAGVQDVVFCNPGVKTVGVEHEKRVVFLGALCYHKIKWHKAAGNILVCRVIGPNMLTKPKHLNERMGGPIFYEHYRF
ncbi:hypothetical protein [uncultured Pseudoflavonifractor sp.]|uniref:hypothetical protein n=1 Tax=uncultured Pseudoflavonifractor sp. TaxID=1221379 RepID=UPI0025F57E09|nr:hypothetical protein [uncultured Pseudoflavonifractor sp.]